jgi:hypothetical protein
MTTRRTGPPYRLPSDRCHDVLVPTFTSPGATTSGDQAAKFVKGLGQGSTLGWLNRRHGPILTTTLPVVPSPADLLVAKL